MRVKRLISVSLAIMMLLTSISITAFAADPGIELHFNDYETGTGRFTIVNNEPGRTVNYWTYKGSGELIEGPVMYSVPIWLNEEGEFKIVANFADAADDSTKVELKGTVTKTSDGATAESAAWSTDNDFAGSPTGVSVNFDRNTRLMSITATTPQQSPPATEPPNIYWAVSQNQVSGPLQALQSSAMPYNGAFQYTPQWNTFYVYVWHTKDTNSQYNAVSKYIVAVDDPPSEQIKFELKPTAPGVNRHELEITTESANPAFDLYYAVTRDGTESTPAPVTGLVNLAYGHEYSVRAFYTQNSGATALGQVTYNVTLSDNGSFSSVTADKALTAIARGRYLFFTGPSNACRYNIKVIDDNTNAVLTSIDEIGPFSDEMFLVPQSTTHFRIEYEIWENGKFAAYTAGSRAAIDATYMPEPYNLTWNSVTEQATAEISLPADTIEYELWDRDRAQTYQVNTTGDFAGIPTGRYELRAYSYNSLDDTLKSAAAKLNVTIDKDPPIISLVPITVSGSTPGVIISATAEGSGLRHIELKINNKQQRNPQSGETVYAIDEGTNTYVVTAYSNSGMSATETVAIEFSKNSLNPSISIEGETFDEDGKLPLWFNDKLTVRVSAANAATKLRYLSLSNGSQMLKMEQKTPAEESISFTYDITTDGVYSLEAQAMAANGQPSGNVEKRTIKIDSVAPTKPEINVSKSGVVDIYSEDKTSGIDYIEYQIIGKSREEYTSEFTVDAWGDVTIRAVAYDVAGNASQVGEWRGKVFNQPLEEPTLNGTSPDWYTSEDGVKVTIDSPASVEGNKIKTYYRIGSTRSADSWRSYKDGDEIHITDEGITTISAYSVDEFGNESDVVTGRVLLDCSPPRMRAINTTPFTPISTNASFRLWFSDEESGIDKLFVSVNGRERRIDITTQHRAQGYVSLTLTLPPVDLTGSTAVAETDGGVDGDFYDPAQHSVVFRALDKAKNESIIELNSRTQDQIKTNPTTGQGYNYSITVE